MTIFSFGFFNVFFVFFKEIVRWGISNYRKKSIFEAYNVIVNMEVIFYVIVKSDKFFYKWF